MWRSICRFFVILALLPSVSNAETIRWSLNDFVFSDGGRADGFFVWDTATADAPSWEISLTGGNVAAFPEFVFTKSNSVFVVRDLRSLDLGITFLWDDLRIGEPARNFRFGLEELTGLNSLDAIIGVVGNTFAGATGAIDCFNCSPARLLSNGGAFLSAQGTTQVPVPAALPLFATTLVCIVFAGWRRRLP